MFAIVDIMGFQEKVEKGAKLRVPLLQAKVGDSVTFDNVYLLSCGKESVEVGTPTVAGASVTAKVVKHGQTDKVRVLKFKRRKRYLKIGSHRQDYTDIEITSLSGKSEKKQDDKK